MFVIRPRLMVVLLLRRLLISIIVLMFPVVWRLRLPVTMLMRLCRFPLIRVTRLVASFRVTRLTRR